VLVDREEEPVERRVLTESDIVLTWWDSVTWLSLAESNIMYMEREEVMRPPLRESLMMIYDQSRQEVALEPMESGRFETPLRMRIWVARWTEWQMESEEQPLKHRRRVWERGRFLRNGDQVMTERVEKRAIEESGVVERHEDQDSVQREKAVREMERQMEQAQQELVQLRDECEEIEKERDASQEEVSCLRKMMKLMTVKTPVQAAIPRRVFLSYGEPVEFEFQAPPIVRDRIVEVEMETWHPEEEPQMVKKDLIYLRPTVEVEEIWRAAETTSRMSRSQFFLTGKNQVLIPTTGRLLAPQGSFALWGRIGGGGRRREKPKATEEQPDVRDYQIRDAKRLIRALRKIAYDILKGERRDEKSQEPTRERKTVMLRVRIDNRNRVTPHLTHGKMFEFEFSAGEKVHKLRKGLIRKLRLKGVWWDLEQQVSVGDEEKYVWCDLKNVMEKLVQDAQTVFQVRIKKTKVKTPNAPGTSKRVKMERANQRAGRKQGLKSYVWEPECQRVVDVSTQKTGTEAAVEVRPWMREEERIDPRDPRYNWQGQIPVRPKDLPAPATAGYIKDDEELRRRRELDMKWTREQALTQRWEEERQEREKEAAREEKEDTERRRCYVMARTEWFAEQRRKREMEALGPRYEPAEWESEWAAVAKLKTARVQQEELARAVMERAQGEERRRKWLETFRREADGTTETQRKQTRGGPDESERARMWRIREEEHKKGEERPPIPKAKETKKERKERKRRGK
jgi:hypothetical protein